MRILNLYACLGGNRYKWGNEHQITAVEIDPELARMYQERFPGDEVIIADAHQYLLDHYKEYDFIWTSPPCPTHSQVRFTQKNQDFYKPAYPEMSLYQEVIFLKHHFEGKYVVENVIPYYEPLIPAQKRGRHLYWCNFILPNNLGDRPEMLGLIGGSKRKQLENLCRLHEIDLSSYRGEQRKDKIARNLVDYQAGKTILETAMGIVKENNKEQLKIF